MEFLCIAKYTLQASVEFSDKWYLTHGYAHGKTQSDYHMFLQYVKINFKEIFFKKLNMKGKTINILINKRMPS